MTIDAHQRPTGDVIVPDAVFDGTIDAHQRPTGDVIVPDAVFDGDGRRQRAGRPADRAILVLAVITAVFVASVIAVGAAVVLTVLIAIGLVVGAVRSIASKVRRA